MHFIKSTIQKYGPYSKVYTALFNGVHSSSIQFPRDMVNILLISFSRFVL